jgi:hypothetical protein
MKTEFYHGSKAASLAAGNYQDKLVQGSRQAIGSVAFAGQPAANDTVTINGTVFTFVAAGAAGNQVNIAASLTLTIDALCTALNASAVAAVAKATYANVAGTSMSVTHDAAGAEGNDFTLAESGANISVSGATLEDGVTADTIDLSAETYGLVTQEGAATAFSLPSGNEGQEVTLYLHTKGTGSNAVVTGVFTGGTTLTFDTAGEFIKGKFLNGTWRVIANTGAIT